jgi:TRAP-type C4-dicarboxylate transport system substrate-binding protein
MNKESYNKLPDNVKKVVDEVSAEYTEKAALMSNNIDVVGADYAKKAGMQFIDLAPDEAAKWQASVAPTIDQYVNDMVGKGYSKQEVQGWIDFIKQRTDYWLKQQAQKGIKSPMGPAEIKQ